MFIKLNHKSLEVYTVIRSLVTEIYRISALMPELEKFNMVQQIRRAATSVKLNFSEGSSRKSELERKRFFEIARGSVVEIDAVLETAVDLNYIKVQDLHLTEILLNKCFAMLSRMIDPK